MSICGDGGFNENFVSWLGVTVLQEGLDAIEVRRELTDDEESLFSVLSELEYRKRTKMYPKMKKGRLQRVLGAAPSGELWSRARKSIKNGRIDLLDLCPRRDDEHAQARHRFYAAKAAAAKPAVQT